MNWLDTQTKELLQKVDKDKLAPPKVLEFTLILLHKDSAPDRLNEAISRINKCTMHGAEKLAAKPVPVIIHRDLTEEDALMGQFELICCDAISLFLRSEIVAGNDASYLSSLYMRVRQSPEFTPVTVSFRDIPKTEAGEKFVKQFLHEAPESFPVQIMVPFKKARIMEHWAGKIGAALTIEKNV